MHRSTEHSTETSLATPVATDSTGDAHCTNTRTSSREAHAAAKHAGTDELTKETQHHEVPAANRTEVHTAAETQQTKSRALAIMVRTQRMSKAKDGPTLSHPWMMQMTPGLWYHMTSLEDQKRKSPFIESLILGLPSPLMSVAPPLCHGWQFGLLKAHSCTDEAKMADTASCLQHWVIVVIRGCST